jgi:DNA-directed RNA polymerase sigma subunit (sigma70/sigma32)
MTQSTKESVKNAGKNLYQILDKYKKEDIDTVLCKLNEKEKDIIRYRFGDDLSMPPIEREYTLTENEIFYKRLIPKIKKLILELTDTELHFIRDEDRKKLDKLKDSELFKEYRKFLSRQEVYVLFLKFGFIDNNCYTDGVVSGYANVRVKEVNEIVKKLISMEKVSNIITETLHNNEEYQKSITLIKQSI